MPTCLHSASTWEWAHTKEVTSITRHMLAVVLTLGHRAVIQLCQAERMGIHQWSRRAQRRQGLSGDIGACTAMQMRILVSSCAWHFMLQDLLACMSWAHPTSISWHLGILLDIRPAPTVIILHTRLQKDIQIVQLIRRKGSRGCSKTLVCNQLFPPAFRATS